MKSTLMDNASIMRDDTKNPNINARIASSVRSLRMESGMNLDTFAAKCDVSRSMISLIERGEGNPTAVVLEKIATGLGVPLAKLFNDMNIAVNPLSRRDDRISWCDPQSGYVRRNISPPNFPSPIQIVEIMLPADASITYDMGSRDVIIHQQLWIQEGNIELTLGSVTYLLSEGDCFAMQLNELTTFRNPTHKPARYIVIITTEYTRIARK